MYLFITESKELQLKKLTYSYNKIITITSKNTAAGRDGIIQIKKDLIFYFHYGPLGEIIMGLEIESLFSETHHVVMPEV